MNKDITVDFPTFYYYQILEDIRKKARELLPDSERQYLESFLGFIEPDGDVQQSLEKLAGYQLTGDLSIFFSDIIDNLPQLSIEEAWNKIPSHVNDFLELFNLLAREDAFRKFISEISKPGEVPEMVKAQVTEEIGFEDYLKWAIREGIRQIINDLPSEKKEEFQKFLNAVLENGARIAELAQKHPANTVREFLTRTRTLTDGKDQIEDIDVYIQTFSHQLREWLQTAKKLILEEPRTVEQILNELVAEEAETETAEVPLEQLFETTSELPQKEIFPTEEARIELEDLAQKAAELEKKRTERIPETEETLKQKQLLKEYVIRQTSGFKEEILQALEKLIHTPDDKQLQEQLLDSLKAFKDLGQIHVYPAIELSAEYLMNLFRKAFRESTKISETIKFPLEEFFGILPDYIHAKLEKKELPHLSRIQERLKRTAEILAQPEMELDFKSLEALRGIYQQILDKYLKNIQNQIQSLPFTEWDDLSANSVTKMLETISFWAQTLKLSEGSKILEKIQKLLTSYYRRYLSSKNVKSLIDILNSLEGKFTTLPPAQWEALNTQLDNILASATEIPVNGAISAFKEIVVKQLNSLREQLSESGTSLIDFVQEKFKPFSHLWVQNSQLIEREDLKKIGDYLSELTLKWQGKSDDWLRSEIGSEGFKHLLKTVEQAVETLPEQIGTDELFEKLNQVFERRIRETALKEAEKAPEEAIAGEKPEPELVTDEEIERVFQNEAQRYLQEIRSSLGKLSENAEQKELWQKLGVAAHTLNGSAQMTGHQEIVDLTMVLEDLIEEIVNGEISPGARAVEVVTQLVETVEGVLKGESVDKKGILSKIEEFRTEATQPEVSVSEAGEAKEVLEEVSEESEKFLEEEAEESVATGSFLMLSETDPEMLKIFEEEVSNNYEVIEKNLANLEKFIFDKGAWQDVERAAHEIHTAAKMLGIGEVGQLAEEMESIVEELLRKKITDYEEAIQLLRKTMQVLRELTSKHQIEKELYDETLENLREYRGRLTQLLPGEEIGVTTPATEITAEVKGKTFVVEASPQLLETFVQEARELLDDVNYLLLKLEKEPDNAELQHHLMRTLHTLKGSAGVVRVQPIEQLAHLSEEIIEDFINKKQAIPGDFFDSLFEVADEISFITESIDTAGKSRTKNYEELIGKLKRFSEAGVEPLVEKEAEAPEAVPPEIKESEPSPEGEETEEEYVKIVEPEGMRERPSASPRDTSIRLDIRQMDHLLNLSAELVIGHTQFKNQLDRLKNYMPMMESELRVFQDTENHLSALLKEAQSIQELLEKNPDMEPAVRDVLKSQLENLERINRNLQALRSEFSNVTHSLKDNTKSYEEHWQKLNTMSSALLDAIMKARLVPINILFQRFHRPIRDLAKKLNKKIKLLIQGENTELDRTLVEELYEPLLHLIRNAIDHGIESVEERKKAGKDPEGLLSIQASSERNQVIIEIKDDGRGIDFDRVKEKAIQQGYLTEEKAESISREDLTEYLFMPGFTTTDEATLVSGRGVGLDVVRAQVEKIKGDLKIHSEPGKGTTITIRVPISLSVLQSMLIDVGGHIYTIPLFQVEETQNISLKDLQKKDGIYYLPYHEQSIPVIQLSRLLVIKGIKPRPLSIAGIYPIIIVQDEGHRVALLVDRIVRREEILIKSLGPTLRRLKYIAGGSIMADGQVVLVLDIPQIVQEVRKMTQQSSNSEVSILLTATESPEAEVVQKRRKKKIIRDRKPNILVVDDSLSIRKYLSNLLTQRGMATETARNGYEALELLNTRQFDLMITDLEMPKLSGYELIEAIRMDDKYSEFPIIVLTGRANENIRRMTEDLGADDYIVKPFKDRELFESIEKFIEI